jgi:hypothetical protein
MSDELAAILDAHETGRVVQDDRGRLSFTAVNRRDAGMVLRLDGFIRKPWRCIASLTNLSCWLTRSGIWAMSIMKGDARIWRRVVTTRPWLFIGVTKTVRLSIWQTPFGASLSSDGSKRERYGKKRETFTPPWASKRESRRARPESQSSQYANAQPQCCSALTGRPKAVQHSYLGERLDRHRPDPGSNYQLLAFS